MELQLALDMVTTQEALDMLHEIGDYVDIVEVGTPFVLREGLKTVTQIKENFPKHRVLADLKIMDAGEHEANLAFEAGADIVTVLGVSNNATIKGAIKAAREWGKEVMVDMIEVSEIEKRAVEIEQMGADYLSVHVAFDIQDTGKNPLDEMLRMKKVLTKSKVAIAGGIKLETLKDIVNNHPDVIIIGGGITGQKDKKKVVKEMRKIIDEGR
ncbi:MAG: 3-hexulose-6-phosphate synthase [Tepidanaerobacteraceae bacterium]|nr:3-hexulose-6-phosphate synthase [Tepidanaerobacteraceae bacterium]